MTHKTTEFNDPILPPSPSEPLQNMIDELEKIAPPQDDPFSEDIGLQDTS